MTVATRPFTGTFEADPAHSSFQFSVTHMRVSTFRASFADVDATVVGRDGRVRLEGAVRVESISITTPAEFREHVVNGADFFDAGNHPEITFRADDIRFDTGGAGGLAVDGELTIKGITRPFAAKGSYQPLVEDPYGNIRTAVELTATVDRRDWGMTWQAPLPKGGDVLGNEVVLSVHAELIRRADR